MSQNEESRRRGHADGGNGTGQPSNYSQHNTDDRRAATPGPVYVGNKVIGEVRRDGVFQKRIHGERHILNRPRAIAWDLSTLKDAEAAGAHAVLVIDLDSEDEYRAPMTTVWRKGWPFNRGHGDQWALRLEHFNKGDVGEQLSLFGD